jgi:hypothetical protein
MYSRRQAIRHIALAGAGICLTGTPTLARAEEIDGGLPRSEQILRAFMDTVIPGAQLDHRDATLVFRDKAYGFSKYRWLFIIDLRNRSGRLFSTGRFHELTQTQRTVVIQDALRSRGLMRRLYSGAIQLTQVAVYSGFYRDPEECPLIDFKVEFEDIGCSYPQAHRFFGRSMTPDGQPL